MSILKTARDIIDISECPTLKKDNRDFKMSVSSIYENNWIKYNNNWYYIKKGLKDVYIVNELMGVELCKYFNIPTIDYLIYQRNKYYGLMSVNRIDSNKEYINSLLFKKNYKDTLYKLMHKLDECLALDFFKIALIGYYMGEKDRNYGNIILRKEDDQIKIDTVLDFSSSFIASGDNHWLYHSNLKTYDLLNGFYTNVIESIPGIINEYEKSRDILKQYKDIDIERILKAIQEKYGIYINSYMINNCVNYGNESKRRVLELL